LEDIGGTSLDGVVKPLNLALLKRRRFDAEAP
jgi:hypothetical protein